MSINGFSQELFEPTRCFGQSATLLDHIFHNNVLPVVTSGILDVGITDHHATFIEIPISLKTENTKEKVIRMFTRNESIYTNFLQCLETKLAFLDPGQNLNLKLESLVNCVQSTVNEFSVCKEQNLRNRKTPWYTNSIKNKIVKKNKLFRLYKKCPTRVNKERFNFARNAVLALIRKTKQAYYGENFENLMNTPKKFYRELNVLTGRNKNVVDYPIVDETGTKISDLKGIADAFNEKFVSIGINALKSLPDTDTEYNVTEFILSNTNSMFLYPVTIEEVSNIVNKMDLTKAVGLDKISGIDLKASLPVLLPVLVELINNSFTDGVFPDCLKLARVIPIFKSGNKSDVDNYRPISILSIFSKIFEKAYFDRLFSFLSKYRILYDKQFGFRPGRSTIDALSELTEKIRDANDMDFSCVFLDLRKAFDTINHEILLAKIERYGVRGVAWKWIKSYLSDRSQVVVINGISSERLTIECGVPQGSILGPLLFLIYINDLPNTSSILEYYTFADDTASIYQKKKSGISVLNEELENLPPWLLSNKVLLNIPKSQAVHYGNSVQYTVKINSEVVENHSSAKYLGIFIDRHLKFDDHIQNLLRKVSRHLSVINKLRKFVAQKILLTYYKVYVQSELSYGLLIYGCTTKNKLKPILQFQKRILRLINSKRRDFPSRILFEKNNILDIYDLYTLELLKFALKSLNKLHVSQYLNNLFIKYNTGHLETRGKVRGKLIIPKAITKMNRNSLKNRGTRLVNYMLDRKLLPDNLGKMNPINVKNFCSELRRKICMNSLSQIVFE